MPRILARQMLEHLQRLRARRSTLQHHLRPEEIDVRYVRMHPVALVEAANQLRRQELDQRADQQVSALRAFVAETSERVARWGQPGQPPAMPVDSVLMLAAAQDIRIAPTGRILYMPTRPNGNEAPSMYFGRGKR